MPRFISSRSGPCKNPVSTRFLLFQPFLFLNLQTFFLLSFLFSQFSGSRTNEAKDDLQKYLNRDKKQRLKSSTVSVDIQEGESRQGSAAIKNIKQEIPYHFVGVVLPPASVSNLQDVGKELSDNVCITSYICT